jgi:hypothetical protein
VEHREATRYARNPRLDHGHQCRTQHVDDRPDRAPDHLRAFAKQLARASIAGDRGADEVGDPGLRNDPSLVGARREPASADGGFQAADPPTAAGLGAVLHREVRDRSGAVPESAPSWRAERPLDAVERAARRAGGARRPPVRVWVAQCPEARANFFCEELRLKRRS